MSGTSPLLARSCAGKAKKPSSSPKNNTALTSPAVAGTITAWSVFSSLTSTPSYRGRRAWAASREIATRNFNARSAGAFFRPRLASNCCVRCSAAYSRAQPAHCSRWRVSARISVPLTWPSRYDENNFLIAEQFLSAYFMASPQLQRQPCCRHANLAANFGQPHRQERAVLTPVSYTHLTLTTNRE